MGLCYRFDDVLDLCYGFDNALDLCYRFDNALDLCWKSRLGWRSWILVARIGIIVNFTFILIIAFFLLDVCE